MPFQKRIKAQDLRKGGHGLRRRNGMGRRVCHSQYESRQRLRGGDQGANAVIVLLSREVLYYHGFSFGFVVPPGCWQGAVYMTPKLSLDLYQVLIALFRVKVSWACGV